VVVCLSASSTYAPYLPRAGAEIREAIVSAIEPGFPGSRIYLRLVTHSSYNAGNLLVDPINIAPIAAAPVKDVQNPFAPTPTPGPDTSAALLDGQGVARHRLAVLATLSQPDLIAQGRAIDRIPLTDFWGCITAAADVFENASGRKLLVLATDFEDNYDPDVCRRFHPPDVCERRLKPRSVDLKGAEVAVVNFTCNDPVTCESRRRFWGDEALKQEARARCVQFLTVGQSITHVFRDRSIC
jgi:hypothetical protein